MQEFITQQAHLEIGQKHPYSSLQMSAKIRQKHQRWGLSDVCEALAKCHAKKVPQKRRANNALSIWQYFREIGLNVKGP